MIQFLELLPASFTEFLQEVKSNVCTSTQYSMGSQLVSLAHAMLIFHSGFRKLRAASFHLVIKHFEEVCLGASRASVMKFHSSI